MASKPDAGAVHRPSPAVAAGSSQHPGSARKLLMAADAVLPATGMRGARRARVLQDARPRDATNRARPWLYEDVASTRGRVSPGVSALRHAAERPASYHVALL